MVAMRRTPNERGTRIELVLDGTDKGVSGLSVIDLEIHIGPVRVRCGGIGNVGTDREYRMKGYARQVLQEGLAFMAEAGYHVSILFGIPDFYPKFGYVSALVDCESAVATRDAETAEGRYAVRDFAPDDAPAVAALYEATHGRRTASAVRDPAAWRGFRLGAGWTDRVGAFVVTEGDAVVGYANVNLDPWRFGVGEVGYRDPTVYGTLLGEMGRLAVESRVERVTFHAPPDDPFVSYCQRYGCETKLVCRRRASGMARIIRQRELLGLLQPLFEQRLAASALAGWNGVLRLRTDLGEDRIVLGRSGRELDVQIPQELLTQWVFGYRPVSDLTFEPDARVDAEALPVLEVLFPRGYPYMWPADRF